MAFLSGEVAWLYMPRLPPSPVLVAEEKVLDKLGWNCGCRNGGRGVAPVNGVGSRELYAAGVVEGVGENDLRGMPPVLSGSRCFA